MDVKYPKITVKLTGRDGNAFVIIGTVIKAMRNGGVEKSELDQFMNEVQAGDYDHLLRTCMRWVNVK
jgi:hypothetical protein